MERSFFRNTKNVESVERPRKVFPSLEETALPLMRQYRAIGLDENRSNINVLLRIMMELKDTNVWSRGSYADVIWIQEQAEKIWKPGGIFLKPA